jgi:hypothetical protein
MLHYHNIEELATDSPLIIIGTVKNLVETYQEGRREYSSIYQFQVEQVLKGKKQSTIQVQQMGDPDNYYMTVAKEDPLLQLGERYLLFLDNGVSGRYVYYGPNSRYQIEDDKVYSMNYVLKDNSYLAPPMLDINGLSLDIITRQIEETLETLRFLGPVSTILLTGEPISKDFTLATGKNGNSKVIFTLDRIVDKTSKDVMPVPQGMTISINPKELMALPYQDYQITVNIKTDETTIKPGEYYFLIKFNDNHNISGEHVFRVVIDEKKLSEMESLYDKIHTTD